MNRLTRSTSSAPDAGPAARSICAPSIVTRWSVGTLVLGLRCSWCQERTDAAERRLRLSWMPPESAILFAEMPILIFQSRAARAESIYTSLQMSRARRSPNRPSTQRSSLLASIYKKNLSGCAGYSMGSVAAVDFTCTATAGKPKAGL
jgi:hypothetical protein